MKFFRIARIPATRPQFGKKQPDRSTAPASTSHRDWQAHRHERSRLNKARKMKEAAGNDFHPVSEPTPRQRHHNYFCSVYFCPCATGCPEDVAPEAGIFAGEGADAGAGGFRPKTIGPGVAENSCTSSSYSFCWRTRKIGPNWLHQIVIHPKTLVPIFFSQAHSFWSGVNALRSPRSRAVCTATLAR